MVRDYDEFNSVLPQHACTSSSENDIVVVEIGIGHLKKYGLLLFSGLCYQSLVVKLIPFILHFKTGPM